MPLNPPHWTFKVTQMRPSRWIWPNLWARLSHLILPHLEAAPPGRYFTFSGCKQPRGSFMSLDWKQKKEDSNGRKTFLFYPRNTDVLWLQTTPPLILHVSLLWHFGVFAVLEQSWSDWQPRLPGSCWSVRCSSSLTGINTLSDGLYSGRQQLLHSHHRENTLKTSFFFKLLCYKIKTSQCNLYFPHSLRTIKH